VEIEGVLPPNPKGTPENNGRTNKYEGFTH
jgi:hypothetical protein